MNRIAHLWLWSCIFALHSVALQISRSILEIKHNERHNLLNICFAHIYSTCILLVFHLRGVIAHEQRMPCSFVDTFCAVHIWLMESFPAATLLLFYDSTSQFKLYRMHFQLFSHWNYDDFLWLWLCRCVFFNPTIAPVLPLPTPRRYLYFDELLILSSLSILQYFYR